MNEKKYAADKDMLISFGDMFFYMCKRWKSLLLLALLGGMLGFGVSYLTSDNEYVPTQQEIVQMNKVYNYKLLGEDQLEYNNEALKEQVANKDYVEGELIYYINAGEKTALFGNALDITKKDSYIDDLRKIFGYEGEERYLRTVVKYTFEENDEMTIYVNQKEGKDTIDNSYGIITYSIVFLEENECKLVMDYIKSKIQEIESEYRAEYGDFTLELASSSVNNDGNNLAYSAQKNVADQVEEIMTDMKECLEQFSSDQLKYYNREYLGLNEEESGFAIIKWLVVGLIFGCFIWGAFYLCKYLFSGCIRISEEFTELYGLHLIGRMPVKNKPIKGLDSVIAKYHNSIKVPECSLEYLTEVLSQQNTKKIMMSCVTNGKSNEQVALKLAERCKNVENAGALSSDLNSVRKLREVDGVVFLVSLGETKKNNFELQLNICGAQGVPVLGVISVDNY